ncbi:helix-turn-helix domain-containing protein [Streptomyces sp. NPDC093801]|uniref:helix-turn-helix domain-containing protein n=1 Tax=Streptomyces sp. NPDC093801 TaxID=3155203 RepID=UPI00344B0755
MEYLDLGPVRVSTSPRTTDPERYQLALVTGDLVLCDTSHPYEAGSTPAADRTVVLQLPRTSLPFRPERVDRLLSQRIPATRGTGAALAQFLGSVGAHADGCGERELARLGSAALGLATACLAERLDVYDDLPAEAREEALLRQIDAYIEHNLADPELTPGAVAARHHISLRRLHLLFEGRPAGVAATIRGRRLAAARADLLRPDLKRRPVHSIAARWGFSSATVFSRAFRQAYGTSPTELRRKRVARKVNDPCAQRTCTGAAPA